MLAVVLGDLGAQTRFLRMAAGTLQAPEAQEGSDLGDEEVFLSTYMEQCYNVRLPRLVGWL